MRICSRCNTKVNKTDFVCPRCGFSLIKDKYGKRVESINSSLAKPKIGNNYNNRQNSGKNVVALVIVIIFLFVTSVPVLLFMNNETMVYDEPNEVEEFINLDLINKYLVDVRRVANDYGLAWKSIEQNKSITLKEVDSIISLEEKDMTNDSCILFNTDSKTDDLLDCVLLSYEEAGIYKDINSDIMSLYEYIQDYQLGDVRNVLVEIYGYAYDLYYLPGSKATYKQYKESYDTSITNLDKMLNLLEDKSV